MRLQKNPQDMLSFYKVTPGTLKATVATNSMATRMESQNGADQVEILDSSGQVVLGIVSLVDTLLRHQLIRLCLHSLDTREIREAAIFE